MQNTITELILYLTFYAIDTRRRFNVIRHLNAFFISIFKGYVRNYWLKICLSYAYTFVKIFKMKSYSMEFKVKKVFSRVYDNYCLFGNTFQDKLVSYRNQSIDLEIKSIDRFLYDTSFY